jgi:hypothetical protein
LPGSSLGSLFFFLSWSHIMSGGLVKLTYFFMNLFFLILLFCIKLFSVKFCQFFASLSILLLQERVGQVNPGHLAFSFIIFFLFNLCLFCKSFLLEVYFSFISVWCYMWWISRVNPNWLRFFSFDFFLISSFCINLFSLELCYFLTFLTIWLFREWVGKINTDWFKVFLMSFLFNFFFLPGHPYDFFFNLDLILHVVGSSS